MSCSRQYIPLYKNSYTKSWFKNNLGKLLQKKLVIKISGRVIYENTGESIYRVYHDLWLKDSIHSNMVEDGIASLAVRKKISKDDAHAYATLAFNIYGTEQRIHLDKIISNHGLYISFNLAHTLSFIITLLPADEIM